MDRLPLSENPDGLYDKTRSWDQEATPIKSVEASWHSGVEVKLPFLKDDSVYRALTIEARSKWPRAEGEPKYEVRIRGGNTNDGPPDAYEQAIRDFDRAVEIGRWFEKVLAMDADEWWGADGDGTDITDAIVRGMPDYVLALYVLTQTNGEADPDWRFAYERGETAVAKIREDVAWPRLDLAQLRERATLLARQAHERKVLEAEIAGQS